MSEWLAGLVPFVIAVVLPPAGVLLGLVEMKQDRELGIRLIVVSLLAAAIWLLLFLV